MFRKFVFPFLLLGFLSLTACTEKNLNEPFLGYWLQETDKQPISLHIKEDGPDVVVRAGQLSFGIYETYNWPGEVKQENLLNMGNGRLQLRYEDGKLVDVDNKQSIFRQIDEAQYKSEVEQKRK